MINIMNKQIVKYLSEIGRKGGKKSRRILSSQQAHLMVKTREAQRAFKKYYALCFWSFDPNLKVKSKDISWVSEYLMKNGNRESYFVGIKLCR